jgi:rubrerythrin
MNVFDFAMRLETDAEAFYRKLAQESPIAGIGKIFTDLAEDEKRHFQIFKSLKEETPQERMTESTVLDTAKSIFARLLQEKDELPALTDDLEGYRYALQIEAEGARMYRDAARREKNDAVKELLLRIAAEEEKHFNIVENIYSFVNAPNQYLAWAEFSNLEEFRAFGRDVDI